MRTRDEIKVIIEAALRTEFPLDTVDVSDGYQNNVHVLVVSRRFDSMEEKAKQDMLWGIIDRSNLTEAERQLITLMLPVSPALLK